MKKQPAFVVYQYALGDGPVTGHFTELHNYLSRNDMVLTKDHMMISGRACEDFKVGDILVSENESIIFVEGFYLYGQVMNFISGGMTCGIWSKTIDEALSEGQLLFLVEQQE